MNTEINMKDIRSYNIGNSDYSKHRIQPWDLWKFVNDGWRADVIKRILREKEGESRLTDYKKIRHILLKIQELITVDNYQFHRSCLQIPPFLLTDVKSEYGLSDEKFWILINMFGDPNDLMIINQSIQLINDIICTL